MSDPEAGRREDACGHSVDSGMVRLDGIMARHVNGGDRVAVKEVLEAVWRDGRRHGLWESGHEVVREAQEVVREATEAPRKPSETTGAISGGSGTTKVTEGHGEADAVGALRGWWEQTAHDEIAGLTAKMVEYGGLSRATDLAEIGRGLVHSGVRTGNKQIEGTDAQYQELGIYFYLLGKFARWTAAVAEGRPVSDDTLLDIGIYVRMAQRIRAVGGWPV